MPYDALTPDQHADNVLALYRQDARSPNRARLTRIIREYCEKRDLKQKTIWDVLKSRGVKKSSKA